MRSYEFESKLNAKVKLGENVSSMCFLRRNGRYTPAVLCFRTEIRDRDFLLTDAAGLIWWDAAAKIPVREDFTAQQREALDLPVKIGELLDEGAEPPEAPDPREYYLTVEKICCALEAGCVTESMKQSYRKLMNFDAMPEAERLMCAVFPDAMQQLN